MICIMDQFKNVQLENDFSQLSSQRIPDSCGYRNDFLRFIERGAFYECGHILVCRPYRSGVSMAIYCDAVVIGDSINKEVKTKFCGSWFIAVKLASLVRNSGTKFQSIGGCAEK